MALRPSCDLTVMWLHESTRVMDGGELGQFLVVIVQDSHGGCNHWGRPGEGHTGPLCIILATFYDYFKIES